MPIKQSKTTVRPTALIILDGFALNKRLLGNAITSATAPHIFSYLKKYPNTTLTTYGEAVGLFPGQQGNSEAGHLNIGAGRIVKQDLVMISEHIHDGTFFKNHAFKEALYHVKKYKTAVHIMGLLTDRNSAHAYPEHLYAMLEFFRREGQKKVFLHLFTDGRDSSPHGAADFLRELRSHILEHEKIATITGRFYAMDRNKIWERTKQAYEAMVLGKGCTANSAEEALSQSYNRGDTDEYICPTVILEHSKPFGSAPFGLSSGRRQGKPVATIKNNDAIFFINARSDRARQITKALVQPDFEKENIGAFHRVHVLKNTRFVAMTDFGPDLPGIFTAFPSPDVPKCLPAVIDGSYKQLYISESEKYAHVTYFINGGYAESLNGEEREQVKSPTIKSYADQPEMNTAMLVEKVVKYFKAGRYNFICVNFPNTDMVGHTGNLESAKKATTVVDKAVEQIVQTVLARNGQILLTADHGNADVMINPKTKEMMTEHTTNPAPCILIRKDCQGIKLKNGRLCDVAPTLLKMMGIKKPKEMTGHSLF